MITMDRPPTRSRWKINFFDCTRDPAWFELWKLYSYCAMWAVVVIGALSPVLAPAIGLTGPGHHSAIVVAGRLLVLAAFGIFDYFVILMPFEWYFHRYLFHRQEVFLGKFNKLRKAHVEHHSDHDDEHYDTRTIPQTFKAHFPGKALPGFGVLFCMPVLLLGLVCHFLFALPMWIVWCAVTGMGFGVLFGYARYEGRFHAQDHRPLAEWWIPRMEDHVRGAHWRHAYAEHRAHHRYPGVNEAVFARDGHSWPSRVFGTYMHADVVVEKDEDGRVHVVVDRGQPMMTYGPQPTPRAWVRRLDIKYGPAFPRTAP